MLTIIVLVQLLIVLSLIFIGARVGGIGLGIYGMVGVFILVFVFGMRPGNIPIDVMLIIASVITATAALQAAGADHLPGSARDVALHHAGWHRPHLLLAAAHHRRDLEELEDTP